MQITTSSSVSRPNHPLRCLNYAVWILCEVLRATPLRDGNITHQALEMSVRTSYHPTLADARSASCLNTQGDILVHLRPFSPLLIFRASDHGNTQ